MDEEEEEVTDLKLQLFHNTIREHIVSHRQHQQQSVCDVTLHQLSALPLYTYAARKSDAAAASLRGEFLLMMPVIAYVCYC